MAKIDGEGQLTGTERCSFDNLLALNTRSKYNNLSEDELIGIKDASHAVAITLRKMREYAKIGMSTKELDDYGLAILESFGANPAPKKDYNFPGCACISINDEVCHGIPSKNKIIRSGDLINIDVSAEVNGFYGDNP